MTLGARITVLLGLLIAVCPASSQVRPPPGAAGAVPVVEGRVFDSDTGEPLVEVTVVIEGPSWARTATTDRAGRYAVPVPAGRPLRIRVERLGYRTSSLDVREIPGDTRIDFRLRRWPISLAPVDVLADSSNRALAALSAEPPDQPGERVRARVGRERAPPLWGAALLSSAQETGGPAPQPGPPPSGGLGVRGSVTRYGATYLSGAPQQLAITASPLVDPFGERAWSNARLWQAGAPARVTGGLEYVLDLSRSLPPAASGTTADLAIDPLRTSADVSWRSDRAALRANLGSTLPWTAGLTGEAGHRSRQVNLRAWTMVEQRHRVGAWATVRDESMPTAASSAAHRLQARETAASIEWTAALGRGVLDVRAGGGRFDARVPPVGEGGAAITMQREQSHVSVEYRAALGDAWAFGAGADHVGQAWENGMAAGAAAAGPTVDAVSVRAAAAGAFTDVAWSPTSRVTFAGGARFEGAVGAAKPAFSPRARATWRPTDWMRLDLGTGVHRQLVPAPPAGRFDEPPYVTFARGLHHAAAITLLGGQWDVRMDAQLKRLQGLPQVEGFVDVRAIGLGVGASIGESGRLDGIVTFERRSAAGVSALSSVIQLEWDQMLPASVRLRSRLGSSRSVGALLLAATPDTLGAGTIHATDGVLPGRASLSLDVELSRGVAAAPVDAYVQLLNAFGTAVRSLYALESRDSRLPRVITAGVRVALGTRATTAATPAAPHR